MTDRPSEIVHAFAAEVGDVGAGPVAVRGGATAWTVGGDSAPGTRIVRAPSGVVSFEPAEMTVRVLAGTPVAELDAALAPMGQTTVLTGPPGATVGGALAVGRDSLGGARWGKLRDALLQARYVAADGRVIKAGGPTVKNVTGYDLCRLLVGSLGTTGCLAEVILRTRPLPEATQWLSGQLPATEVAAALYRPLAVLTNGTTTWVGLEGYAVDVAAQTERALALGLRLAEAPPAASSINAGGASQPSEAVVALNRRVRDQFDPTRRLNPGRDPLGIG